MIIRELYRIITPEHHNQAERKNDKAIHQSKKLAKVVRWIFLNNEGQIILNELFQNMLMLQEVELLKNHSIMTMPLSSQSGMINEPIGCTDFSLHRTRDVGDKITFIKLPKSRYLFFKSTISNRDRTRKSAIHLKICEALTRTDFIRNKHFKY